MLSTMSSRSDEDVDEDALKCAIEACINAQAVINFSAQNLYGLRTQCSSSLELTQIEIKTLESKLVRLFSTQLTEKRKFPNADFGEMKKFPDLKQWLQIVGISSGSITALCDHFDGFEDFYKAKEAKLRSLICEAQEKRGEKNEGRGDKEEIRRLLTAMRNLWMCMEKKLHENADIDLHWGSWDRTNTTINGTASAPIISLALSPNRSPNMSPPVTSPDQADSCFVDEPYLPVPPRSPRATGGMVHVIHHRFHKTVKMKSVVCNLCKQHMFYGYKCKECKYYCHGECKGKVPPSCGLSNELVDVFRRHIANGEGRHSPISSFAGHSNITSPSSIKSESLGREQSKTAKARHNKPLINVPPFGGPDSSSNTSSCTSSAPSSPAFIITSSSAQTPVSTSRIHSFNFPDPVSSLATTSRSVSSGSIHARNNGVRDSLPSSHPLINREVVETQKSNDSDKTVSVASGSTSTDSEKTLACRIDSQDSQVSDLDPNDRNWPRQNSLTSREWDIQPADVKLLEITGTGRFGTVWKGEYYGLVAVKYLNMSNGADVNRSIEAFKQEVAMFRKTRHENLVLFMGAIMQPPKPAIITTFLKGQTLYNHLHYRKDKFGVNTILKIAQQIAQGMSYLHARGIVHKDLKTKNIFYDNGKIVITDFGLFSVTRLCNMNRKGDWLTIPKGWLCYLAPEVIRSLRADQNQENEELDFTTATDVFAFGTVWYELLLGEWPFKGQPSEVIVWQVGRGMKQSLTNLTASKEIKDLLMICWAFRPEERPEFSKLLDSLTKLPKKRLQRSPSHPIHLVRAAESDF